MPPAYNAAMNRLLDKTIVLLGCLALMAQGPIDAPQIVGLCTAITCACLGEVLPRHWRVLPAIGLAACALCIPGASAFLPLAAYDAERGSRAQFCGIAILGLLALGSMRGQGANALCMMVLLIAVAVLLSVRSGEAERTARRNRVTRDELQERALSLESKNRDLIDRQSYEVELATLAERARIAREIHDNVGHLLTRASLQVEALRVMHSGEPRVQADFADVGSTLSEALDTVRASVHALREDAVDLSVQMRKVAEDVTAETPLSVTVEAKCERVPAAVATALLALEREAISNTLRHSDATRLRIRCLEHPALYQFTIKDNGSAQRSAEAGHGGALGCADGMGLASMRERVEALGGSFSAGPEPSGGWRVFASIPK